MYISWNKLIEILESCFDLASNEFSITYLERLENARVKLFKSCVQSWPRLTDDKWAGPSSVI